MRPWKKQRTRSPDCIDMQISLKGTNLQILESTREYVDRKLVHAVEKIMTDGDSAVVLKIEVEKTTEHHQKGKIFRAEANLSMGKTLLRAEALGESLNEAIDILENELSREIKHFKGKRRTEMLKGARRVKGK